MNQTHPLINDLSKLSNDNLDKKYNLLIQRYYTARRMNMDANVLRQLELLLDDMENEKNNRMNSDKTTDENPVVIDTDKDIL